MRLIDVDVFEKHLEDKWILHEISNKGLEQIGEWLAQEQTVDAIPMEWIMKYYEDHPAGFVCGMIYDWAMEQAERKE